MSEQLRDQKALRDPHAQDVVWIFRAIPDATCRLRDRPENLGDHCNVTIFKIDLGLPWVSPGTCLFKAIQIAPPISRSSVDVSLFEPMRTALVHSKRETFLRAGLRGANLHRRIPDRFLFAFNRRTPKVAS
jgi:hypothetical protein